MVCHYIALMVSFLLYLLGGGKLMPRPLLLPFSLFSFLFLGEIRFYLLAKMAIP